MKIVNTHKLVIKDQKVVTGALSKQNEAVLLLDNGDVINVNTETEEKKLLFSVKTSIQYSDGGFDLSDFCRIYTLGDIVVLVNEYKTHGFIHYPGHYDRLRIQRGDYHANLSSYPITLFNNELGIPHLVYAIDWNNVQIINLDTRQRLTATKSLIPEDAVKDHLDYYQNRPEEDVHIWPQEFDYFYGELLRSPDQSKFLSAGWVWGSADAYKVFDIDNFIKSNTVQEINIGFWEHNARGACWIDDTTIAVSYSKFAEGETDVKEENSEIHLYRISANEAKLERKIEYQDIDISRSVIFYDKETNSIVAYDNKIEKLGVAILSMDGITLFQDKTLKTDAFYPKYRRFIQIAENGISIFELVD